MAGMVRVIGPLFWVLLHGLAMSNHWSLTESASSREFSVEDVQRVLVAALMDLVPR